MFVPIQRRHCPECYSPRTKFVPVVQVASCRLCKDTGYYPPLDGNPPPCQVNPEGGVRPGTEFQVNWNAQNKTYVVINSDQVFNEEPIIFFEHTELEKAVQVCGLIQSLLDSEQLETVADLFSFSMVSYLKLLFNDAQTRQCFMAVFKADLQQRETERLAADAARGHKL